MARLYTDNDAGGTTGFESSLLSVVWWDLLIRPKKGDQEYFSWKQLDQFIKILNSKQPPSRKIDIFYWMLVFSIFLKQHIVKHLLERPRHLPNGSPIMADWNSLLVTGLTPFLLVFRPSYAPIPLKIFIFTLVKKCLLNKQA